MRVRSQKMMEQVSHSVQDALKHGFYALRDLVVPPTCLMCDTLVYESGGCCTECWRKTRFISRPFCEVYGTPFSYDLGEGALSADAIANPPAFRKVRSAVFYDEAIISLVSGLKYSDRLDLAPWMANWMLRAGRESFQENPIIIPIPLYKTRLLARKFNQAAELARNIGKKKKLEYAPHLLVRLKKTKQQVGLSREERLNNMVGAFKVPKELAVQLKGRSILLVDDVYTTGATVSAATHALQKAGSGPVDVLTFARVETFIE
ncbi:MAG: ComF family protein [Nitratireductor sp.]